jgi:prepilin-type N-terminal cleavage/methylation domain-containing protein
MNKRGFTLLEMLLSISLIAVLAGGFLPVYSAVYVKNDLELASTGLVSSLRRAQLLAQAVDGDATWGVRIAPGAITLFQGPSYAGRVVGTEEIFTISESITPAGIGEVLFSKMLGGPNPAGDITLTASNNEVRTITITAKGTLTY